MEKRNKKQNWVTTFSKLLPGFGAIIAGVFIPLIINANAQKNRSAQLYTEIVSRREVADSELRARMFENLLRYFFENGSQEKSDYDGDKLMLLRLLALNFHDSFDLKPLFEEMESELPEKGKDKLRDIAKEIVGKQEALLSQIEEGRVFERIIHIGRSETIPPEEEKSYRGHHLGIEVLEIGEKEDYVKIRIRDFPDELNGDKKDIGDIIDFEFKVNSYDMPFIDNTKLFNNTRFAVTFKDVVEDTSDTEMGKAANLKIIFFPESYMSSRDRPFLEEMLDQLRKR